MRTSNVGEGLPGTPPDTVVLGLVTGLSADEGKDNVEEACAVEHEEGPSAAAAIRWKDAAMDLRTCARKEEKEVQSRGQKMTHIDT